MRGLRISVWLIVVLAFPAVAMAFTGTSTGTASSGPGSGTVTSVATGPGLTGGPITSTGTVNFATTSPVGGSSAPFWARFFGDGNEGAYSGSGTLLGEHWYTTFNCTGAISAGNRNPLIIRATTSITLGSGCALNFGAVASGQFGFLGGAGGGGGGGAGTGVSGNNTNFFGVSSATLAIGTFESTATGGTSGNPGNSGSGPLNASTANAQPYLAAGFPAMARSSGGNCGGGTGGQGGSTGGTGGQAGSCVVLYAPVINITAGATIDVSSANGNAATANSTGGGGGAGGGFAGLYAESFTGVTPSSIIFAGGGEGGQCTTPALYLKNGAGDDTGTGASLVVTGLTTGGLDATKITVTGGSGYTVAPSVVIVAGTSGLTGSPAAHTTISGGAVASVVIDTAGSGGTLATYSTCSVGGYGGDGWYNIGTIQ